MTKPPNPFTYIFYDHDQIQFGTYLGDDKDKGAFFMRPSLRYDISKRLFAQIGFKTLDGGAADYIEYGIGFRPFSW